MSKRKCTIPKGHKLFTHPNFGKPFNYLIIDTVNQRYNWCEEDVTTKLTVGMWPLSTLPNCLRVCARQVVR